MSKCTRHLPTAICHLEHVKASASAVNRSAKSYMLQISERLHPPCDNCRCRMQLWHPCLEPMYLNCIAICELLHFLPSAAVHAQIYIPQAANNQGNIGHMKASNAVVLKSALSAACDSQNGYLDLATFCISFPRCLQAVVKLPFADVKRLAIAAQQPDATEQELQPADEVCTCKPR